MRTAQLLAIVLALLAIAAGIKDFNVEVVATIALWSLMAVAFDGIANRKTAR